MWHIEQSLAVAAARPSRAQVPCSFVHSWKWLPGGFVRSIVSWQVAQPVLAGALSAWQAGEEALRVANPGAPTRFLSIPRW